LKPCLHKELFYRINFINKKPVFDLNLENSDISSGFSKIISAYIKPGKHNRWTVIEYDFCHY